jgi:hypothetical protein
MPVRRVSALLTASFRHHLTMTALAVQLGVPLTGPPVDLHHLVPYLTSLVRSSSAIHGAARHAWRTKKKPRRLAGFPCQIS